MDLWKLFRDSEGEPVNYNGKELIMADKFKVDKKFSFEVELLEKDSEWTQGICIRTDGEFVIGADTDKKRVSLIDRIWTEQDVGPIKIIGTSRDGELYVYNSWYEGGTHEYWVRNAAMHREKIGENEYVYHCNDGHWDIRLDRLVFRIKLLEGIGDFDVREFSDVEKAIITEQWRKAVPEMKRYRDMWVVRVLGPVAVGVKLKIKDKRFYTPVLHFHNLIETGAIKVVGEKALTTDYVTTYSPTDKYLSLIEDAKYMEERLFKKDVSIRDLIRMILECYKTCAPKDKLKLLKLYLTVGIWSENKELLGRIQNDISSKLSLLKIEGFFADETAYEEAKCMLNETIEEKTELEEKVKQNLKKLKLTS